MGLRFLPRGTKVYPVRGKNISRLWPCKPVKLNKDFPFQHDERHKPVLWLADETHDSGKDAKNFSKFKDGTRWGFTQVDPDKLYVKDPLDPKPIYVYGFIFAIKDML